MSQDVSIEMKDKSGNDVDNDGDMPAKNSDVDSCHSDNKPLISPGRDETEGGGRETGARVKRPQIELIQVCTQS